MGTLSVWSREVDAFSAEDERILGMMGSQVATAVVAAEATEASEHLAHHDALTGLPNRLQLAKDIAEDFQASQMEGRSAVVAMLDIDYFKRFKADTVANTGVSAAVFADKLEAFRALRFTYDESGQSVTDPRLNPSPSASLSEDVEGCVDWLDASGAVLPDVHGSEYVRRWRISTVAADEPETIAIDVCVFSIRAAHRGPHHADACLATLRVRQP